jgi:hypothetical protein
MLALSHRKRFDLLKQGILAQSIFELTKALSMRRYPLGSIAQYLRILFKFVCLSSSITLPNRYAQHPAIICPLTIPDLSRICPLPGFLSTRMFQHIDGCFYSHLNSTISERILRLKPWYRFTAALAATGSTPSMNGGACAPSSGQRRVGTGAIEDLLG